mgnify:CR=1 FL=1
MIRLYKWIALVLFKSAFRVEILELNETYECSFVVGLLHMDEPYHKAMGIKMALDKLKIGRGLI